MDGRNRSGSGSLHTIVALSFFLLNFAGFAFAQQQCGQCHADIVAKYAKTGMGRSFFIPAPANMMEDYARNNSYFHAASNIHYVMMQRNGAYFQKRYQIGLNGEETNVLEERIDYVLGSGNHARTYLHRTQQGTLVQLPLGWYAEKGGYWAMSPGYDTPDHPGSRRPIGNDCMFCHNAFPTGTATRDRVGDVPVFPAQLPQGIDCQRCHGPAQNHAVNPAKFSPERSMEVCMQCHLEPDSLSPSLDFKRYGKSWSSYRPGEPLANFMVFFTAGSDDRFQIAGTAYEFRKSACFLKSFGKLQCTTCHNPHEETHGVQTTAKYNAVCGTCHSQPANHATRTNCVECHMPKRRTTDVVHVVMTDHYIRPVPLTGDLLADRPEDHSIGQAKTHAEPYYPIGTNDPLYLAMAKIRNGENVGVWRPHTADAWFEIAEAERKAGQTQSSITAYRNCLALDPGYANAQLGLAESLRDAKQPAQAALAFTRATKLMPTDARPWNSLAQTQMDLRQMANARASFARAIAVDAAMPDPHNWLGILNAESGDAKNAETEFHAAILLQPNYAEAHANLANLFALEGFTALAVVEFDAAIAIKPHDTAIRTNYASLLIRLGRYDAAKLQLESTLQSNPALAEVHEMLGQLLAREGNRAAALPHLRLAAASGNPGTRKIAIQLLEDLAHPDH